MLQQQQLNDDLNAINKGTPKPKQEIKEKKEEVPKNLLPANPSENDFSVSFSVSAFNKLKAKDKNKKQIYEYIDYEDPKCQVVAFKKISIGRPVTRLNCFVTSFPFSGHSTFESNGREVMPEIKGTLNNQEEILSQLS